MYVMFYYCQVPALQLCNYSKVQLQELSHREMLVIMFPNLNELPNICLTIPVSTASDEWSFSQMKMISLEIVLEIAISTIWLAIKSPDVLTSSELDCIVDVWNENLEELLYRFFAYYFLIFIISNQIHQFVDLSHFINELCT